MKRTTRMKMFSRRLVCAFTLLELLVVFLVISVLAALLLPTLSRGKDRARRARCSSNLRQLGLASISYANDDSRQSLSGKQQSEDQNLNWLLPHAGSSQLFVCPSTKNYIRTNFGVAPYTNEKGFIDLFAMAKRKVGPGMSYQGFGFLGVDVDTSEEIPVYGGVRVLNGIRKNMNNIQTDRHFHKTFGLNGTIPGPSRLWLITDNALFGTLYYPDSGDNHEDFMVNTVFCDGHVEFIGQKQFIYSYELSQDENRTGI